MLENALKTTYILGFEKLLEYNGSLAFKIY